MVIGHRTYKSGTIDQWVQPRSRGAPSPESPAVNLWALSGKRRYGALDKRAAQPPLVWCDAHPTLPVVCGRHATPPERASVACPNRLNALRDWLAISGQRAAGRL